MVLTERPLSAAKQRQQEARDRYRQSLQDEKPLTGAQLGTEFGRSERWGQFRIEEVHDSALISTQPSEPSTPQGDSLMSLPPVTPPNTETEDDPVQERKGLARVFHRKPKRRSVPSQRPTRAPRRRREPNPQRRGASFASWVAFGLGITMSVAANVAHIWFVTRPDGQAALYAAMILAAFWPLALAVSVEVISRVGYPQGVSWALARFGGIGAVGAVAAVVSYLHMHSLLTYFGESNLSAVVGPLGVDGLLIVGGFALFAIGETRKAAKVDVA